MKLRASFISIVSLRPQSVQTGKPLGQVVRVHQDTGIFSTRIMHQRKAAVETRATAGAGAGDKVPEEEVPMRTKKQRSALLHDFCMCIPYGLIVVVGGLLAALLGAGSSGLIIAAAGAAELVASGQSLGAWKVGKSSTPYTLMSAIVASWLAWSTYSLAKRGVVSIISGLLCGMSVLAATFFTYNILAGGNPPKHKIPKPQQQA